MATAIVEEVEEAIDLSENDYNPNIDNSSNNNNSNNNQNNNKNSNNNALNLPHNNNPAEAFLQEVKSLINHDDVAHLLTLQTEM